MKRFLLAASAALVFAHETSATIPAADGTITACYSWPFATLRVIDAPARRCFAFERTLSWSRSGGAAPDLAQVKSDLAATQAELAATRAALVATQAEFAAFRTAVGSDLAAARAAIAELRASVDAGATRALGGVLTLDASGARPLVRVNGADVEFADDAVLATRGDLLVQAGRGIVIEAATDLVTTAGRNAMTAIGQNASTTVGGSAELVVGADAATTIGRSAVTRVVLDSTTTIGRNAAESVAANRTESVGGNSTSSVGGATSLSSTQVSVSAAATLGLQASVVDAPGLVLAGQLVAGSANIGGLTLP